MPLFILVFVNIFLLVVLSVFMLHGAVCVCVCVCVCVESWSDSLCDRIDWRVARHWFNCGLCFDLPANKAALSRHQSLGLHNLHFHI
jgi:hypothetical protein